LKLQQLLPSTPESAAQSATLVGAPAATWVGIGSVALEFANGKLREPSSISIAVAGKVDCGHFIAALQCSRERAASRRGRLTLDEIH
jgi:hypothetical protein